MDMEQVVEEKQEGDAHKNQQRHLDAGFLVDLRNQVGSGHIDGYASGNGKAGGNGMLEHHHGEHAGKSGRPQQGGSAPGGGAAASAGQHDRGHGETFGNFVQEDGDEDDPSQPAGNQKPGGDGNAVEKSVDHQAEQHGNAFARLHEFRGVRFLAEMEVGRDRVLNEMDKQVTEQNQESGAEAAQLHALGNHFHHGGGQHETRAQGDKILEVGLLPAFADYDGAAQEIGGGRRQAEQDAEGDRVHGVSSRFSVLGSQFA